jgi:hypothetical protein
MPVLADELVEGLKDELAIGSRRAGLFVVTARTLGAVVSVGKVVAS